MARTKRRRRPAEHASADTSQQRASSLENSNAFEAFEGSSDDEPHHAARAQDLSLGNVCTDEVAAEATMEQPDGLNSTDAAVLQQPKPRPRKPRSQEAALKRKERKKEKKAQAMRSERPILLFDLNGVLVSERASGEYRTSWRMRPGIEQLVRLQHKYHLGVFSSAERPNVQRALSQVLSAIMLQPQAATELVNGVDANSHSSNGTLLALFQRFQPQIPGHPEAEQLFKLLLCRKDCIPDPTRDHRPDGKKWDTVKPLQQNGLPLGRVLLVDNELRKALPDEQDSLLILPTWEYSPDQGQAAWQQLVNSLLDLPVEDDIDVRTCTSQVNSLIAATSGTSNQAAAATSSQQRLTSIATAAAAVQGAKAVGHKAQQERTISQPSNTHEGAEPPRKLRRTAVVQDVRDVQVVSADGYLLTAEELQGHCQAADDDNGSILRAWQTGGVSSQEGGDLDPEALQVDAQEDGDAETGDDVSGSGLETGSNDGEFDTDSELYQDMADQLASMDNGYAAEGDGYEGQPELSVQQQHGQHKRGRQLEGAAPLYCGPHALIPHANGAEHSQQQGHASRLHGPHDPQLSTLHHELAAFAAAAAPTDELVALLDAAVATVQAAARSVWPQARAVLFGSQASGLALPGSDLDVVVLGALRRDVDNAGQLQGQATQVKRALALLVEKLKRMGVMSKYEIIRAKVPIIKASMLIHCIMPNRPWNGSKKKAPTIAVDISIGAANGAAAVLLMQRCVRTVPVLRPLCLAVKALLKDARLNEVFHGGLSSYTVFNMVLAHLQCEGFGSAAADALRGASKEDLQAMQQATCVQHVAATGHSSKQPLNGITQQEDGEGSNSQRQQAARNLVALDRQLPDYLQHVRDSCSGASCQQTWGGYDLGDLLLSFLFRYSCVVDWSCEGVSVRRGGIIEAFTRANAGVKKWHLQRLSVEDPQQAHRDLCEGSFSWPLVRLVFQAAMQQLVACSPLDDRCHGLPNYLAQQLRLPTRAKGKGGHTRPGPPHSNSQALHTVGQLGRLLQQYVKGKSGNLSRVCQVAAAWPGWVSSHHPPRAGQHRGPAASTARADTKPGGSSNAVTGVQEEQLWAAVQQEGSHMSQAYAHLLQGSSQATGGDGAAPLAWATQLPFLFDIHATLRIPNASGNVVAVPDQPQPAPKRPRPRRGKQRAAAAEQTPGKNKGKVKHEGKAAKRVRDHDDTISSPNKKSKGRGGWVMG